MEGKEKKQTRQKDISEDCIWFVIRRVKGAGSTGVRYVQYETITRSSDIPPPSAIHGFVRNSEQSVYFLY